MIANPELMDVWLRGRSGAVLSEVERHRFSNMCLKAFWFFSASHFQLRMKTLSDEDWAEFAAVLRFWIEGPGVRTWWQNTGRLRFGAAFACFVDAEIEKLATPAAAAAALS